MTSRELRTQRREAERKTRKLAYQESRNAASASAGAPESSFSPGEQRSSALALNSDLFDEFSAEEQAEMSALRARVHARASQASSPESPAPARKSGGPTSPQGKATSSANSLKHGLASGRVIIPGEDPADFEALLRDLAAEHAPATPTEQLLVQQMAQSWWLLQRAIRIQNQAFTETRVDTHKLALFLRYQTTYERAFYRALNSLTKLKNERRKTTREFVSQRSCINPSVPEFVSQKFAQGASGSAREAAICPSQTQVPRQIA